jgi:plasmid stabilization system protein ParE
LLFVSSSYAASVGEDVAPDKLTPGNSTCRTRRGSVYEDHEIDRLCLTISDWPEYGRAREDVRKGLRSVPLGRYLVFYRPTRDAIELFRVLDERRDVEAIFSDGG